MPDQNATDPLLTEALQALQGPGLLIGHRIIQPGDEEALQPGELGDREQATPKVRRQSGAARMVARELLARTGRPCAALPRRPDGLPEWPDGVIGSLAHDEQVAVAAMMTANKGGSVGIDVEPSEPLPPGIAERVSTPGERQRHGPDILESRVLFCAKEAAYKAFFSKTGQSLGFQDIDIDLEGGKAVLRGGHELSIAVITVPRIVALAQSLD